MLEPMIYIRIIIIFNYYDHITVLLPHEILGMYCVTKKKWVIRSIETGTYIIIRRVVH